MRSNLACLRARAAGRPGPPPHGACPPTSHRLGRRARPIPRARPARAARACRARRRRPRPRPGPLLPPTRSVTRRSTLPHATRPTRTSSAREHTRARPCSSSPRARHTTHTHTHTHTSRGRLDAHSPQPTPHTEIRARELAQPEAENVGAALAAEMSELARATTAELLAEIKRRVFCLDKPEQRLILVGACGGGGGEGVGGCALGVGGGLGEQWGWRKGGW
jgi:hypothetical protein